MARELEEEKQLQSMEDLQSEIASLKDKEKVRAVFIWVSKGNWFCVYYATWLA